MIGFTATHTVTQIYRHIIDHPRLQHSQYLPLIAWHNWALNNYVDDHRHRYSTDTTWFHIDHIEKSFRIHPDIDTQLESDPSLFTYLISIPLLGKYKTGKTALIQPGVLGTDWTATLTRLSDAAVTEPVHPELVDDPKQYVKQIVANQICDAYLTTNQHGIILLSDRIKKLET